MNFGSFVVKKKKKTLSDHLWLPVLPTLRFSREFGLVFLSSCGFFLRLAGCLFLGLFYLKFACFLQIAFFPNFMALLPFQFTAKSILGVFLWKIAHFGLVFSDLPPWSFLFSSWFFVLLNYPANTFWSCFSVKLPIFGLFFKFTWLFLQINLASLCAPEMITIRFADWISGRIVSLQPDTDIRYLLWNGNRSRISETLLLIFRGFRLVEKVAHCTIIHLLSSFRSIFSAICAMIPSLAMVYSLYHSVISFPS